MTRQELRNYISLKGEIAELRQELVELERTAPVVTDTVQGSSPSLPYAKHSVVIAGVDPKAMKKINENRRRLRILIEQYEAQREQVRSWIDAIPDSTTRQIFRLRYLKRMSWVQIAHRLDSYRSPEAVRKIHDRFLKKF